MLGQNRANGENVGRGKGRKPAAQAGRGRLAAFLACAVLCASLASKGILPVEEANEPSAVYQLFANEQAVAVKDPYFKKQWALYNDGTFRYQGNSGGGRGMYGSSISNSGSISSGSSVNLGSSAGFAYGQVAAKAGIDIGMKEAWALYNGGVRETIVAVIDTGIDYSHEDLEGLFWTNTGEIAGDGIDNDKNGYVDDVYGWNFYDDSPYVYVGLEDSHGTHSAGTIGAGLNGFGVAGIAGNSTVKIMILKALGGSGGVGSTESVVEAIRYAEANGAVICNLSFGTTASDKRLRQAIEESNMLFVAASGNGNSRTGIGYDIDKSPVYPASYNLDNVIAVANLQADGTLHSSSNYGVKSVDMAAPGTFVVSTTTGDTYSYMSGTSMAAPMVTAAAALLYSQYPDLSLAGVRELLLSTVTPLDSLSGQVETGGMLNVAAALSADITVLPEYGQPASGSTEAPEAASGTEGQGGSVKQGGKAPVIRTKVWEQGSAMKLTVKITDTDGDLKTVRYLSGTHTVEDFKGGTAGKAFKLNANSKKRFTPKPGKVYTIYARDAAGNETVKAVKATIEL